MLIKHLCTALIFANEKKKINVNTVYFFNFEFKMYFMAKQVHKKVSANGKTSKDGFRVVKESPATTKINKAIIDRAVEKALSTTSR